MRMDIKIHCSRLQRGGGSWRQTNTPHLDFSSAHSTLHLSLIVGLLVARLGVMSVAVVRRDWVAIGGAEGEPW